MKRKMLATCVLSVLLVTSLLLTISAQQMVRMDAAKLAPKVEKALEEIRRGLIEVKSEMSGMACCIGPSCNFCALVAARCPCGANVRSESGVCGECYDGWHAGQGRMQGVKASDVKHWNATMLDSMFKARASIFSKAQKPAGTPR